MSTVLLVMDCQKAITSRFAKTPDMLTPVQQALKFARESKIKVIYVIIYHRDGYPESTDARKEKILKMGAKMDGDMLNIDDSVKPLDNEIVVKKLRVSAFSGSDLEVILRAQKIDHLVLAGIATSGVVLSTVREAADKDYNITVLSDACIDQDAEVHRVLMEKVFPKQAEVLTVGGWIQKKTQ